jgi:hypothetical protein
MIWAWDEVNIAEVIVQCTPICVPSNWRGSLIVCLATMEAHPTTFEFVGTFVGTARGARAARLDLKGLRTTLLVLFCETVAKLAGILELATPSVGMIVGIVRRRVRESLESSAL